MTKLQDMFTQARRAQTGGGMGFLGKSKGEIKPRATALVVELTTVQPGAAEAAIKAGADGLLFAWNGKDNDALTSIKQEIESAKASNENLVTGLQIEAGWNKLNHDKLSELKEQGIQYVILPLEAPAHLLALPTKDVEMVVAVPMRSDDMYPLFIRNLTAFDNIEGVLLDFDLASNIGTMSIEDTLQYRAVREAVRFPALLKAKGDMSEAEVYTLFTLGVQAFILPMSSVDETSKGQIKHLSTILEKIYAEEKEASSKK